MLHRLPKFNQLIHMLGAGDRKSTTSQVHFDIFIPEETSQLASIVNLQGFG